MPSAQDRDNWLSFRDAFAFSSGVYGKGEYEQDIPLMTRPMTLLLLATGESQVCCLPSSPLYRDSKWQPASYNLVRNL